MFGIKKLIRSVLTDEYIFNSGEKEITKILCTISGYDLLHSFRGGIFLRLVKNQDFINAIVKAINDLQIKK